MDFQNAVRKCLQNYATFSGRARRSEFWWFSAFGVLVSLAASLVDSLLFGASFDDPSYASALAGLALLLPQVSVGVRRLHDIGRSGWWWWLGIVPVVGWIVLVVWYCQDSKPGTNAHGPDPKGRQVVQPMAPPGDLSALTSPLPQVPRREEP